MPKKFGKLKKREKIERTVHVVIEVEKPVSKKDLLEAMKKAGIDTKL